MAFVRWTGGLPTNVASATISKNGIVAFNPAACRLMRLRSGSRIVLDWDEENELIGISKAGTNETDYFKVGRKGSTSLAVWVRPFLHGVGVLRDEYHRLPILTLGNGWGISVARIRVKKQIRSVLYTY